MSRLFDGVDDIMTYTTGSTSWTHGTILIVCKFAGADSTWQSLIECTDAANATRFSMGRRVGGQVYLANSVGLESAGSAVAASGWQIIAVTKATGTVAPQVHIMPIGGSRTTTTFGNTLANGGGSGVRIHIGGPGDFANIYVAAGAVWNGVVLTTTQLDGILSAKTTASILALSPTWATDDSDFSQDLTASNWDRSAITGTASDADNPSGWSYGAGGTDATVTAVPAASAGSAPAAGVTAAYGLDTFESRGNGTLGAPWATFGGKALPTVSSGEVFANADLTVDAAANPVSIGPDMLSEITLASAPTVTTNMTFDVYARISALTSGADYYIFRMTGTVWRLLSRTSGGAETVILQVSRGQTLSTITGLRLTCVGTTITGYANVSSSWTQVIQTTDSGITGAGYPGFGTALASGGSNPIGVEEAVWGSAGGTNATVTAVPALSAGSAPIGAFGSGSTVTAVPALSLGSAPPANQIISIVINAPAVVSLGSAPVASVSAGGGDATISAVAALSSGSAPVAALGTGSTVTAVPAVSVGTAPVGAFASGSTVTASPALSAGQAPRATLSPAPAGGGGTVQVAATFAEDAA